MPKSKVIHANIKPATRRDPPCSEKIPNDATWKAICQAKQGKGLTKWRSLDELKAKF